MVIKQYDDIFEAIRFYEPNSPLLNIKKNRSGHLKRDLAFNLMQMPNGKMSALPKNLFATFYRGENDDYDLKYPCIPGIFRENPTDDEILINRLKIIDFSIIVKNHPKVRFAERDGMDIHYDALAQHYGLKTDLLDLTTDIAVAAFFATHEFDQENNCYNPISEGIGYIRCYNAPEILAGDLSTIKLIGLQPFDRPGVQCAFAMKLKPDEDFSIISRKVMFKQNKYYNKKINRMFCNNNFNELIPPEDEISRISNYVKKSKKVSRKAISIYCQDKSINEKEICIRIRKNGFTIVNNEIYKLTRQRRRAIERSIKDNPYGKVKIYTRLCYNGK